jgi:hypothetical protein
MCACARAINLTEGFEHILLVLGIEAWASVVAFKLKLDFIFLETVGLDYRTSREDFAFIGKFDRILPGVSDCNPVIRHSEHLPQ